MANWEAVSQRTWRGEWDAVALSPSDSALCFWSRRLLRDPQRRVCRHALWAVNTAECSGFFRRRTMGLSDMTDRLQTTCQAEVSTSISFRLHADRAWHTHLPAKHPHLIIESVLAPYCAPRGSSAHKMATEKNPDGFQQADIAGWAVSWCKIKHHAEQVLCLCNLVAMILCDVISYSNHHQNIKCYYLWN